MLVMCFSALIFLVSCSNDEGKSEKITLNLALWDEEAREIIDNVVSDFEEQHSNVSVNVTYTPWSDYWTKTRTSLAGGKGPDVFWINGHYFYPFAMNGFIKSLQPYIEEENLDVSVYPETLIDLYSTEGELYGMPHFLDTIALFYNKELFDEQGIDYPDETWTWEDIREQGEILTNEEEGIYGYVAQVKPQEGYDNLIHQAGGFVISEDRKKSGYNTPESLKAFKWMEELMEAGISPSIKQQMETEPKQIFGSGKAAMIPLISVNVPEMYELLGENLGVAQLPGDEEKAAYVHGVSWAINENTEHDELAWELVKALTGEEGNKYIAESGFSIPAYEGTEDAWIEELPEVDLNVFIESLDFGFPAPVSKDSAKWRDVVEEELQNAFLGSKKIEEALKVIEEEMNDILENEE